MRLLKRNEAGDISLTGDRLTDIPPYAILSHTWGGEEITFKDMVDGPDRLKEGYKKIQFCADQAWRDGFHFCWVDTCCIDKSSSAELQEAINSMFRWYQNASRCYVYLADVSASESTALDWLPSFQSSRWHTRGWTLQELLAPVSVEFFSKEGLRIGSRMTLEQYISDVTSIPVRALRGSSTFDFTIEQRIAWMETRQTTRAEDKAYAMLGILNICMPLLYGEGEEHAFERLLDLAQKATHRFSEKVVAGSSWGLMESISFPEMHSRWYQVLSGADKTLDWFVENEAFLQWKGSDSDFLWVKGKPGSGKSTLMKHIVNLPEWKGHKVVRHFITARSSQMEMSTEGVCRTLLHQLLPLCPAYLRLMTIEFTQRQKIRGKISEGKWKWEANELKEHLKHLLLHKEMPSIYIFVDALDELGEGPATSLVSYFSNIISRARCQTKLVHICVACRKFPLIALDGLSISVDKQNSADISNYISSQAEVFGVSERYGKVLQYICDKANGVFLWVALILPGVLQMCRKRRQVADILEKVRSLPTDLHTLYQTLLDGVSVLDQIRALRLFQWLCYYPTTLEAPKLIYVVALIDQSHPEYHPQLVEEAEQWEDIGIQITDMSCGLAELVSAERVRHSNPVAQVIHQSVTDYLLSGGLQRLDSALIDPKTGSCLYIMKSIGEMSKTCSEPSDSAMDFITDMWEAMAGQCNLLEDGPPSVVESAVKIFGKHEKQSPLHILYRRGLFRSFDLYISRPELDINCIGDRKETIFFHAVSRDDIATAKKLLETGRVDINRRRDDGCSLLLFLIYNCKPLSLCAWLLDMPGVDVNVRNTRGQNGIHLAILNARVEIVRLLLLRDRSLAFEQDFDGRTPTVYVNELKSLYVAGKYIEPSWLAKAEDRQYITKDPAETIMRLLNPERNVAGTSKPLDIQSNGPPFQGASVFSGEPPSFYTY